MSASAGGGAMRRPLRFDEVREVVRLEERRLAAAVARLAEFSEPFAGGVLARGAPGLWVNACYGAGLEPEPAPANARPEAPGADGGFPGGIRAVGVAHAPDERRETSAQPVRQRLDRESIAHLCAFHRAAGVEPRIELAPFVEPESLSALAEFGFVVRGFDSVLARSLEDIDPGSPSEAPPGIAIEAVDADDPAAVDACARVALSGFPAATSPAAEASLESMRRALALPGVSAIVAKAEAEADHEAETDGTDGPQGRIVAAGAIEVIGAVACLFGASVAPAARRRGIQGALLRERLRMSRAAGARYATIGSRPGAATERNARRLGFELAYIRTAFVRPEAGLVAIVE
ncbi:MAG TPA: hypothetical protein PKC43_02885 [Phycisphaerales bacterium]|nr:hypothetical protein [Phycisphaerales bacterium]HMP36372.1 hypothetical protein [Phycisphaerales bacterium]